MVTPVQKNGAYVNEGSFESSPEGESAAFTSNSGFAEATSNINLQTGYQASRESSGWNTTAETESEAQFLNFQGGFSLDFADQSYGNVEYRFPGTEGAVRLWELLGVSQPEADFAFYLTGLPGTGGANVEVGPAVPPTASDVKALASSRSSEEQIRVLGMSADAVHTVFEDPEREGPNQWPFSAPGALLEYIGTGNTAPILVGVDNEGHFVNNCSRQLLGDSANGEGRNPISTNGSKIFFTDACEGELFARVDNGEEDQRTVPISEPSSEECSQCDTEPAARKPAKFVAASENGAYVFFTTEQPLLSGTGGLYEYDFEAPEGEKVTLVAPGTVSAPRVSEDGSHIYFLSERVLSQEASPDAKGVDEQGNEVESGSVAQPGNNNLYVFERDASYPAGHIAYVATVEQADTSALVEQSDATPDGRFLVFVSEAQLTSDDTSTGQQLFEYDSQSRSLIRVSIGEHGYNDDGNTSEAAQIPRNDATVNEKFSPSLYSETLPVSANGEYVFFSSSDALTPEAINGLANNVYEYHAGNVYLISDGQDLTKHAGGSQVHFLSTDLSGRDVFFETTDQLVPQDTDSNKDIYDARIDGGFPSPAPTVPCNADACQGPLSPAPVLLSPGSEFQEGGNPTTKATTPAVKPEPKGKAKPRKTQSKKKSKRKKKPKAKPHGASASRNARNRGRRHGKGDGS
jgi:hypothetical protein